MPVARFCSACGAGLDRVPPTRCTRCGADHWRNAKPCANGIVVDQGRVLLVRRAYRDAPWFESWCAPGGFCELGEHPISTVEREVLEESGVEVEVTGYIGVWVDAYSDAPLPEDVEMINVGYYHAVPVGFGGTVDPREVSDVGWFAWDELPAELAPPGTLVDVLAAARAAHERGVAATDLPDRS